VVRGKPNGPATAVIPLNKSSNFLGLFLSCCADRGNASIVGGDFNAVLGSLLEGDDVELLGTFGLGDRNDRGRLFACWILQNGLLVQSRMTGMDHLRDSWTCPRSMDGALVQMDFILGSSHFHIVAILCDFSFPMDHRSVHCFWYSSRGH